MGSTRGQEEDVDVITLTWMLTWLSMDERPCRVGAWNESSRRSSFRDHFPVDLTRKSLLLYPVGAGVQAMHGVSRISYIFAYIHAT